MGDGTIVIKKSSDNTVIETINSTSGQVSGSGTNTITINPTTTLQDATEYYILISNTAFRDLAGNYFAGISSTTAWSFVTSDTNPPIISSISSSNADGVYGAGSTIVVVLNFSESVTSTGDVMVTLETGSADRSCTFSLSHSNTGSCEYVVQSGDVSSDLSVISVSGTIRDQFNNQMSNFTAQTNLESLKNIVIDTEAPTTPGKPTNLSLSSDATPTWSWGLSSDSSAITYIVEWSIDSSFNANVFSTTTDASEFTHSSSLTAQTWYFRVKASDAAGNVSGYSEIGETSIAALSDQSSLKRSNSEFGSRDSESLPSEPRILLNDFTEFTSGSGYPIKVKVDDTYAFKVEDEEHVMIIKEIGSDYVDFEIHSEMQSFRLNISETGRFDVNNDGVNDISILVKNISNETAEIIVAQILPSSTTKQKSTTLTSDSGDAKSSTSSSSKIILVIVVLVIIITLYLFAKKRNLSKKQ